MAHPSRAIAAVGGLRVLAVLGGALLALGMVTPVVVAGEDTPAATVVILFGLVAGPALVLLFGAIRLPRSDVHPAFYPTVATWSVGAVVGIALLLGLYDLQPTGGIVNPVSAVPPLLAVAAATGFAGGIHDARARTRQRELDERNRELDERNRELDDRNCELDQRNRELDERNRELRRTRAELERAVDRLQASNERLEQFAYAVSHDLQEPLRTVSGHLQLLERRYDDDLEDDAREFLELSVDAAERMREMVEGLLRYSRVETEAQPFEPVDLNDVLADVCTDLGQRVEESDAEVVVEDLPTVEGDRDQLRQVFQNLLDNAIEYSGDEPPRVHVSAEPAERPQRDADGEARADATGVAASAIDAAEVGDGATDAAEVEDGATDAAGVEADAGDATGAEADATDAAGVEADAGDAAEMEADADDGKTPADFRTIAVRDEGIGMEPSETERIFEVFERLHGPGEHEGTGVGLAICKRIVERHGGQIWADAEPGEGTTVFLTLPTGDADGADGATADRWADAEPPTSGEASTTGERPTNDDEAQTYPDDAPTGGGSRHAVPRRSAATVRGR